MCDKIGQVWILPEFKQNEIYFSLIICKVRLKFTEICKNLSKKFWIWIYKYKSLNPRNSMSQNHAKKKHTLRICHQAQAWEGYRL